MLGKKSNTLTYSEIDYSGGSIVLRAMGALLRASLIASTIMYPTVALTPSSESADLFTLVFAVLASSIVFVEYMVDTPAIFEFRFARPYNRFRYLLMTAIILLLVIELDAALSGDFQLGLLASFQAMSGQLMSGSLSPSLFLVDALGQKNLSVGNSFQDILSFTFLATMIASFVLGFWVWIGPWPLSKEGFNLWPNMPSFSLRAGQRASAQMIKVALLSFALALTLPYLIPMFVEYGRVQLGVDYMNSPITIFWVIFFWATIPALSFLRTVTLLKLAFLAENLRKF